MLKVNNKNTKTTECYLLQNHLGQKPLANPLQSDSLVTAEFTYYPRQILSCGNNGSLLLAKFDARCKIYMLQILLSLCRCNTTCYSQQHCVKRVNLRIQSEYRKIGSEKNPYMDTFHAVQNQPLVSLVRNNWPLLVTKITVCKTQFLLVVKLFFLSL